MSDVDASAVEARRRGWDEYLNAPGLSRGALGYRILEAYAAGYSRADVSHLTGMAVGYVSRLASLARVSS